MTTPREVTLDEFMTCAEQLINEGIQQGMELGMLQGMELGIQQTAKKMLEMGTNLNFISAVTGLSKKTLETLMESNTTVD